MGGSSARRLCRCARRASPDARDAVIAKDPVAGDDGQVFLERLGDEAAELHRGLEGGWTVRQLAALREIIEA